jgi:mannosyltransferase OCH1-like enzyme
MFLFTIWINKSNKKSNIDIPEVKNFYERKKRIYPKILEFKLYFFEDLYKLLKEYDNELAFYFNKINLNYAALLSDIGRIFILYKFGGIYQDLRIMFKNNKTIFLIKKYLENGISLILEENGQSIRIGNLASKNNSEILKKYLNNIKEKLKNYYNKKMIENNCFIYGSGTLIELFKKLSKNDNDFYEYEDEKIKKINWNVRLESKLNKIYNNNGHWSKLKIPIFNY